MGFFSKIKKVVKKVTKQGEKAVKGVVKTATGQSDEPNVVVQQAPAAETPAPQAAQPAELATQTDVQSEDQGTTESSKRRQSASGKRSLSIARSGGTGINI
ncbi:hypothetical protein [Enterobacter roggenkampii]|uniref:hypothetical protein n=1 Tax=Enterobacter roggenkampii TaxID=1812935 RepID=UPI0035D46DE3